MQVRVPIRFSDFDRFEHVNHTRVLVFCEEHRTEMFTQIEVQTGERWSEFGLVVARVEADYRRPIEAGSRGGGVAAETARLSHEAGATVIVADIDVGAADEVAARLAADGPPVSSIRLDVTNPESMDDVAAQLRERHGAVDHVIAAAGIYPTAAFASIDDASAHR